MTLQVIPDQTGGNTTPGYLLVSQGVGNPPVFKSQLNCPNQGIFVNTSALVMTSTTTLANVPNLAAPLQASSTYQINAFLPISTNATAGANVAFATADTLTVTSIDYAIILESAVASAAANSTTLTGSGGTALNIVSIYVTGIINTNAAGTLVLQAAPIASTTGTMTVLANGYLELERVS